MNAYTHSALLPDAEAALPISSKSGQRGTYSPVISTESTTCRHTVDREHWHREYLRLRKIGDRKGAKHAHARCMAATCALLGGQNVNTAMERSDA